MTHHDRLLKTHVLEPTKTILSRTRATLLTLSR